MNYIHVDFTKPHGMLISVLIYVDAVKSQLYCPKIQSWLRMIKSALLPVAEGGFLAPTSPLYPSHRLPFLPLEVAALEVGPLYPSRGSEGTL